MKQKGDMDRLMIWNSSIFILMNLPMILYMIIVEFILC